MFSRERGRRRVLRQPARLAADLARGSCRGRRTPSAPPSSDSRPREARRSPPEKTVLAIVFGCALAALIEERLRQDRGRCDGHKDLLGVGRVVWRIDPFGVNPKRAAARALALRCSCMPPSRDIVVVGAGVIGCAIAYELARRGASVEIVDDRAAGMGATQASAGLLAPFIEAEAEAARCSTSRFAASSCTTTSSRASSPTAASPCRIGAPER